MDEWLDRWMNGWIDGWTDGQMDEWMDRWITWGMGEQVGTWIDSIWMATESEHWKCRVKMYGKLRFRGESNEEEPGLDM